VRPRVLLLACPIACIVCGLYDLGAAFIFPWGFWKLISGTLSACAFGVSQDMFRKNSKHGHDWHGQSGW
jgi:hypothetical protein